MQFATITFLKIFLTTRTRSSVRKNETLISEGCLYIWIEADIFRYLRWKTKLQKYVLHVIRVSFISLDFRPFADITAL
jgi:hypothetical protein